MATSGPENSSEKENVFSSCRKVVSDDATRTADGRLFHSPGAATENDRSPRVDRLTGTGVPNNRPGPTRPDLVDKPLLDPKCTTAASPTHSYLAPMTR